jgi:hypothetical protein
MPFYGQYFAPVPESPVFTGPAFGYIYSPAHIEWVLSTLPPEADFSRYGTELYETGDSDVFFWELEQRLLAQLLPTWNQGQLGSCVSHGWGRALQDRLLVQIAKGVREMWAGFEVAREPIYGGSRVQVGGERGSYQDGSVGAWAAKWAESAGGIILCTKYGSIDLSNGYDAKRCREWGAKGCPEELVPEAKKHQATVGVMQSGQNCWDALGNWNPVAICGSKGRTMKRQQGGWCQVQGTWAHCQCLRGRCTVKGGRRAIVYGNSWGDYLGSENNTVELESGRTIILPPGHYLSELDSIDQECRQSDTFAVSHGNGWERLDIPWLFK